MIVEPAITGRLRLIRPVDTYNRHFPQPALWGWGAPQHNCDIRITFSIRWSLRGGAGIVDRAVGFSVLDETSEDQDSCYYGDLNPNPTATSQGDPRAGPFGDEDS